MEARNTAVKKPSVELAELVVPSGRDSSNPRCIECGGAVVSKGQNWRCLECGRWFLKFYRAKRSRDSPPCIECGGKTVSRGDSWGCVDCGRRFIKRPRKGRDSCSSDSESQEV